MAKHRNYKQNVNFRKRIILNETRCYSINSILISEVSDYFWTLSH